MAKLWLECDSTTTQQARNKANGGIKDVKTCRIFAKKYENEELFAAKWRKLWLECNSTTTQIARNRNATNNRDEKYEYRLEMFVHNGTYVS